MSVGYVALACDVGPGGHLAHCAIESQSPDGLGFGAAALALSTQFQVSVWTDEGLPTVGGRLNVPIRYEAAPAAATAVRAGARSDPGGAGLVSGFPALSQTLGFVVHGHCA